MMINIFLIEKEGDNVKVMVSGSQTEIVATMVGAMQQSEEVANIILSAASAFFGLSEDEEE